MIMTITRVIIRVIIDHLYCNDSIYCNEGCGQTGATGEASKESPLHGSPHFLINSIIKSNVWLEFESCTWSIFIECFIRHFSTAKLASTFLHL